MIEPLIGSSRHIKTIETITTPEEQLQKIREKNVKLVTGEQLYKHGMQDNNNKIYEHYDEEEVCSCNNDSETILDLITEESYIKLRKLECHQYTQG